MSGQKRSKISIIGAGQIGGMAGLLMGQKELGDIVLYDIVPNMPSGKAMDQWQLSAIEGFDCKFEGTNKYEPISGSDVVVVIAGVPRKQGMSRDDLVEVNAKVMREVGSNIAKFCPDSFVICVTNPLDVMVQVLHQATGFPPNRVVGMGGILDAARFKHYLAVALEVSVADIQTIVLGGHGDTMVPIPRMTSVGGIPLEDLIATGAITQSQIDSIVVRTTNGGAEVIGLLGSSAYHAPAAAVCEMVEAYLKDKKRVLPCAAFLNGQYGVTGHFIGVPVVIGAGGVEKVIELKLKPEEMQRFEKSARAVIELQKKVPESQPQ